MYKILEAQDERGKPVRIVVNTSLGREIHEKGLNKLLVLQIDPDSIGEDDSFEDIEERMSEAITNICPSLFIGRAVKPDIVELYFCIDNSATETDLVIETELEASFYIITDDECFIYNEITQGNLLSSDNLVSIAGVENLLDSWAEIGIQMDSEYPVMFSFYSAFKDKTDEFERKLRDMGYEVERSTKRTLLIFKGQILRVEKKRRWTVETLKSEFAKIILLANKHSSIIEGIYARKTDDAT